MAPDVGSQLEKGEGVYTAAVNGPVTQTPTDSTFTDRKTIASSKGHASSMP